METKARAKKATKKFNRSLKASTAIKQDKSKIEDFYGFNNIIDIKTNKKQPNPKKIEFLGYFNAWRSKKDFLVTNNPDIEDLNFSVDDYTSIMESINSNKELNLKKKILFQNKVHDYDAINTINRIDEYSLFKLISDLILSETNVLLYGYGSKLELIFNYINYFQEKINTSSISSNENYEDSNEKYFHFKKPYYHIINLNAFNSDVKFSMIFEVIQNYLLSYSEDSSNVSFKKFFNGCKTEEDSIYRLSTFKDSLKEFKGVILLVINNLDGPSLLGKKAQKLISLLVTFLDMRVIATVDNLYLTYYWSHEVKDYFSFCFLKYNTFKPYIYEINDKFSITGEKTVKSGEGFAQIFKSLTDKQKNMIKIMANYQLNEDKNPINTLTYNKLTDLLIDNMIIANSAQIKSLLFEPMDHDVIVERKYKNGRSYYKLNLSLEVLNNLNNNVYDKKD